MSTIDDPQKRKDSVAMVGMMQEVSGHPPVMWGPSIIGFDTYQYVYDSGHGGDMCVIGFSPRKNALTLYLFDGHEDSVPQLERLGKHTVGKACLYIKRLSDVDLDVLREMIETSYVRTKQMWSEGSHDKS